MKWKKRQIELNKLRARHGRDRGKINNFPNLKLDVHGLPMKTAKSASRLDCPPGLKKEQLELILGSNFVIEHLHKSGYQILLKGDAQWFGKKP